MSTIAMENPALAEYLSKQPMTTSEPTSQEGKEIENTVSSEESRLIISDIVSLSHDAPDDMKTIVIDSQTRSVNSNFPSTLKSSTTSLPNATEVVIVQTHDLKNVSDTHNVEEQEGFSDVAETVIIQTHDNIKIASTNDSAIGHHQQQIGPESIRNVIDICVDSETHENLISIKKATGTELNPTVLSLDPNASTSTVAMESLATMVTRSMSGTISREVFNCEECDYSSHNKHYLKQHVDLVHNEERPYKCPFCEYAGKRSHSLREHLIVHSNERPFECTHCNATFRKKGHLTNHIKLHQKTVNCPLCQKSISHSDVEAHIKLAHNSEKLYVCEICSHVASDQDGIMKHLQKHKNQQIYICSSCNFMTPDFNIFLKHAESHAEADKAKEKNLQKVKPTEPVKPPSTSQAQPNAKIMVVCSECRFVAPNAEVMKSHMWKHIDQTKIEAPAPAPVTQNALDRKSNMEASTKLAATNVGQTSESNQEITTKTTMVASNASPEKSSYKCVECDFVCTEAYGFVVHMLSHRPDLQQQATSTLQTPTKAYQETSSPAKQNTSQQRSPVVSKVPEPRLTSEATVSKETNIRTSNSPPKMVKQTQNPPFVHDVANARFHCTICGYSCEYQRTIKAHIWKHSGNKNIDYPMFQNGPLSIYDDTPITKEEVTSQQGNSNMAANKTVLVEVTPKPRPSLKSPVFEKYKNAKHDGNSKGKVSGGNVSTVSTVAPALAHLLAARAIAGLKQKAETSSCEVEQQKNKKLASSPCKQEVTKNLRVNDIKVVKMTENKVNTEISESEGNKVDTVKTNQMEKDLTNSTKVEMVTFAFGSGSQNANVNTNPTDGTKSKMLDMNKVNVSRHAEESPIDQVSTDKIHLVSSKREQNGETENLTGSSCSKLAKGKKSFKVQDTGKLQALNFDKKPASAEKVLLPERTTLDNLNHATSAKASVTSSDMSEDINMSHLEKADSKRKRKLFSPVEDGEIQQVAKRFCTVDVENNQTSVVVETVDSISADNGLTGMTSQQNSPRIAEISQTEPDCSDSGVASDSNTVLSSPQGLAVTGQGQVQKPVETVVRKRVSSSDVGAEDINSDSSTDDLMEIDNCESDNMLDNSERRKALKDKPRQRTKSMAESAVTLLSLLKKGPNLNPACPLNVSHQSIEKFDCTSQESQQSDSVESSPQPKSGGISSSLLAVIEQLRERSQSENEVGENSSKKSAKKKTRRESVENITPMDDVDNVEEFVESSETKYRCKLCHYSNTNTYVIKQHMKLHKTKQPFECSLCDFMAESSETLQDHMIKHCKVRTYQCKLCSSAFNYKSQLRAHMRAHNEDVFVCDYCDFESTNPITFRNHVRAHNEKKQYKCEVCEKRFLTKYDLRSHKRASCSKQRSFFCEECDFVAIGPHEQKSHAKIHHKEFKCGKCDYVTTSITRFQNHMKSHEEPKVLKCELCDFPAVSNRSLKSHMKRHINDQRFVQQPLEQYKCNLCGYVCHHLPSLKSHMWRHASDQNYSYEFTNEVINAAIDYDGRLDSEECKKSDIAEFNQTIREKMKEKLEGQENVDMSSAQYAVCWVTFRCCQCGFETINKAELNVHMKSHSDVIQWTLQVSQNNSSPNQSTSKRRSEILKETAAIG